MPDATPNYLTVDAAGNVGADFAGHLHAQGVDLDSGTTSTPPTSDRIRWLLQPGGGLVADIYGYYNGTSDLTLESHALSATDDAAVAFLANGGGGGQSGVRAVSKNAAHPASVDSVTAQAGGVSVKVIDGTGASVFARYSDVSGNPKQFEIHGQYSVNFNLPASGSADYDVPLGFNLGSSWLPLGAFFNNANGTASDRCTWRYTNVGASTMRITIANTFSGIGAQSAFFFYVLNVV